MKLVISPSTLFEQSGYFAYVVSIILGQSVRNDLTGVRVDREMELAPRSAMAAVSLLVPLALSEQFQARAVDNQMSSSRNHTRSPCSKLTATSAECGVVRNAERSRPNRRSTLLANASA